MSAFRGVKKGADAIRSRKEQGLIFNFLKFKIGKKIFKLAWNSLEYSRTEFRFKTFLCFVESTLLKTLFQQPSLSNRLKSLPAYNRFAVARFDYCSPAVIPEFFMQDVFGPFTLPQDLGRLVGRFHGITTGNAFSERKSRFEHSANLDEVNQAMDAYRRFCVSRPDWMIERFEPKGCF